MAGFIRTIQLIGDFSNDTMGIQPYITMIFGGIVCSIFLYYGFNEVRSAGISYIVEHKHSNEEIPNHTIPTKFLASSAALGTGLPAGREGPAVVIGGALSYFLCEKLNFSPQDINRAILIGSAAATTATFQAPLGGSIFAAEVPYKQDADLSLFMPAVFASIIAFLTYWGIFEWIFEKDPRLLHISISESFDITSEHLIQAVILGICCGIIGIGFATFFQFFKIFIREYMKKQEYLTPIIGVILAAIIVGCFALLQDDYSLAGSGFETLDLLDQNKDELELFTILLLLFGMILATSFAVGGGNSGGVFGPSLVVGALTGIAFSILLGVEEHSTVFMVMGMAASHTSVTKTPIASVVLILEISGVPPDLIIFMALANLSAYLVSGEKSLYSGQLVSREEKIRRELDSLDHIDDIYVSDVMTKEVRVFYPEMPLIDVKISFQATKLHSIPVLERQNLVGILAVDDLLRVENTGIDLENTRVQDVMVKDVLFVYGDDHLRIVLGYIANTGFERFPVLDRRTKKLIGIITLRTIIRSYEERKTEWEKGIRKVHRV